MYMSGFSVVRAGRGVIFGNKSDPASLIFNRSMRVVSCFSKPLASHRECLAAEIVQVKLASQVSGVWGTKTVPIAVETLVGLSILAPIL
jgi:hypothetical protein